LIRLSAGSAAALQLKTVKTDIQPTTVYLLQGTACRGACLFCPLGRRSSSRSRTYLGRITWPAYPRAALEKPLNQAEQQGLQRICLQSVAEETLERSLLPTLRWIKRLSSLPCSVSVRIETLHQAAELFRAGADRVNIALDAANPRFFARIKDKSFAETQALLFSCAERWPGKISTHLICGLGETEEELLQTGARILEKNITLGLFAFTPLSGTPLGSLPPPEEQQYRRIQAGLFLLRQEPALFLRFRFLQGRLTSFGLAPAQLRKRLSAGSAFQTSGCPGCNRPYYNERPGKTMYNYPRPLTAEEIARVLKILLENLAEGEMLHERKMAAPLGSTAGSRSEHE